MKYSECFMTLQGEGAFTGVPSVFFRTSYCNLRCWFCDTPYTSWEPENKDITVEEAVAKIGSYDCEHVVITGGEPFVQRKELAQLCEQLVENGHFITIETNATIYHETKAQFISMSPKLSNSTPTTEQTLELSKSITASKTWPNKHERDRIKPEIIRRFILNQGLDNCQVKFVVATPEDFKEIRQLEDEVDIPREIITLMPEGINKKDLAEKEVWLAELCKEHKYRYCPRLHVNIWGSKRGI